MKGRERISSFFLGCVCDRKKLSEHFTFGTSFFLPIFPLFLYICRALILGRDRSWRVVGRVLSLLCSGGAAQGHSHVRADVRVFPRRQQRIECFRMEHEPERRRPFDGLIDPQPRVCLESAIVELSLAIRPKKNNNLTTVSPRSLGCF